jgi:hypothetical protein
VENFGPSAVSTVSTDQVVSSTSVIAVLDASAKLNSGFLMGNIYSFGNYEQCLAINEPVGGSLIKGQYCNLFLEPLNHTFDQVRK